MAALASWSLLSFAIQEASGEFLNFRSSPHNRHTPLLVDLPDVSIIQWWEHGLISCPIIAPLGLRLFPIWSF